MTWFFFVREGLYIQNLEKSFFGVQGKVGKGMADPTVTGFAMISAVAASPVWDEWIAAYWMNRNPNPDSNPQKLCTAYI